MLLTSWPMALAFFCYIVFSILAMVTKITEQYLCVALEVLHNNAFGSRVKYFHASTSILRTTDNSGIAGKALNYRP